MKSILLLVAISLMLVGATVAMTFPNSVEAASRFVWCYTAASLVCGEGAENFNGKGECKKAEAAEPLIVVDSCHKVPSS
jgi:hypothetical protein